MHNSDLPWQVTSTQLIKYALVHAEKKTDFDKHIAYLLLDIGVETIYKIFLFNHAFNQFKETLEDDKKETRELSFYKLLQSVKKAAGKKIQDIDIDQTNYFHNLRNQIYHQGDGVAPTDENLLRYASLAKLLLKVLLDVDIDKQQEIERAKASDQSYYSAERIRENILSLQSNSAIMVEHLYPQIGSRRFEAQLRNIRTITGPNDESYSPLQQAGIRQKRIEEFNKITKWEFEYDESDLNDYEFVEYIIDHPEHFCVWVTFQEIDEENWREDWMKYIRIIEYDSRNASEEAFKWTHQKAISIINLVEKNIQGVTVLYPATDLRNFKLF